MRREYEMDLSNENIKLYGKKTTVKGNQYIENDVIHSSFIEHLYANKIKMGNLTDRVMALKKELDSILEELAKEKEEEFKPELGDSYWVIDGSGEPDAERWHDYHYDETALKNNAIFKTKEEAEFEAERMKVLRELEKLGRAFKPNLSNYSICLHHDSQDNQRKLFYKAMTEVEHVYGDYYFDSLPKAKDAVYRIGEERIMKYLFRAED